MSLTLCAVDLMPASASFSAGALNLEGVALLVCLQATSKAEKNPRPVVMGSSLQSGPIRASSGSCRPNKKSEGPSYNSFQLVRLCLVALVQARKLFLRMRQI
jgi:hypothetical protein